MATEYRVVFAGAVLDGYEIETVRQTAGHRLKVTPEQLVRLFSGKPVVLKKGLDLAAAEHYVAELNRIGMKARVEPVSATATAPQKVESYAPPPPVPPSAQPFPSLTLADQEPASATQAPAADLSGAPTYVIPKNQIEATRLRLEEALAAHDDLTRAPTVIVPSAQSADARRTAASAPTVIIPRQDGRGTVAVTPEGTAHLKKAQPKSRDSERTLIADEDALNAYLTNSSDPIGLLDPSGPDLPPVIPTAPAPRETPPLPPIPELRLAPSEPPPSPLAATEPEIPPPPPPLPFLEAAPVAMQEAGPEADPDDGFATPPPPLPASAMPQMPPPVPSAQNRRVLPKTLPQEAAILARPERDTPPRSRGLTLPIKILLSVVLLGGIAGIGLLVWILVNA